MPHHPLPFFNDRPANTVVDTLVIHAMYDDREPVSASHPHPDPSSPHGCFALLAANEVSAHYAIARDGTLWELVPESKRAWHSRSRQEPRDRMPFPDDSREQINDFSIGVELIATGPHSDYTTEQYDTLIALIGAIRTRHPLTTVVGHEQIAPGRKSDPGNRFDWNRLLNAPETRGLRFPQEMLQGQKGSAQSC